MRLINLVPLILLVSLVLITGCARVTAIRQHQDFDQLAKHSATAVIMPVQMKVELLTFTGENEKLAEDEMRLNLALRQAIRTKLGGTGLDFVTFDFGLEAQRDEDFAFSVTQAHEAFNIARRELYGEGAKEILENGGTFNTSLGPVLNLVADRTGADIAVFVRYAGFKKSAGMISKDIAAAVLIGALTGQAYMPAEVGSKVELALVSTNTGDVLWTNGMQANELSAKAVIQALSQFPDPQWKREAPVY